MLCVRASTLRMCQTFDCRLSPMTAFATSCSALSLLHSFQNFIVALCGLIFGSEMITLVGRSEASPTIRASPMSRIGNTSVSPAKLSGKSFLITVWSSAFESRKAIKLLHWLNTVQQFCLHVSNSKIYNFSCCLIFFNCHLLNFKLFPVGSEDSKFHC